MLFKEYKKIIDSTEASERMRRKGDNHGMDTDTQRNNTVHISRHRGFCGERRNKFVG